MWSDCRQKRRANPIGSDDNQIALAAQASPSSPSASASKRASSSEDSNRLAIQWLNESGVGSFGGTSPFNTRSAKSRTKAALAMCHNEIAVDRASSGSLVGVPVSLTTLRR